MSEKDELLSEINDLLDVSIVPSLNSLSAANDLYEAYLFCLVVEVARTEGASAITYRTINGSSPSTFIFRTSPGYINSTTQNYGFAEIVFDDRPVLEAHVGIRVAGHSQVAHECDVCVLYQKEADKCRATSVHVAPRSSQLLLSIEAKFYSTSLGLHLGREFLGFMADMGKKSSYFVVNSESESIEKLLSSKTCNWEHRVCPANQHEVDRLKSQFQIAFRDFKARN